MSTHPLSEQESSQPERGAQRARKAGRWKKFLGWAGLILVLLWAATQLIGYAAEARIRERRMPECRWEEAERDVRPQPYLAKWCFMERDLIVVRLFDAEGKTLLAERTFEYPTFARFYWEPDRLGYLTTEGDGQISLPPTLMDRLRLVLP